jgi:hypothetical protein
MRVQNWTPDQYRGVRSLSKTAQVTVNADGSQHVVYRLADAAKHPSFLGGSAAYFGATAVATTTHADLVSMLEKNAALVRPENGFDNIVTTMKGMIQDTNVQHVVVSMSAGAGTYPFFLWWFKRSRLGQLGIEPKALAICASTALAVVVFFLLTFFTAPAVTVDQCKQGYPQYKGTLSEKKFAEACSKLELN